MFEQLKSAILCEHHTIENLNTFGIFGSIIEEPRQFDLKAVPPQFEIVWIVGKELKYFHGIRRSFYLNTLIPAQTLRRKTFEDVGFPHPVTYTVCPIILCVDRLGDSLTIHYIQRVQEMLWYLNR